MFVKYLLEQGGLIMVFIMIASVLAVFIVIERLLHFHRAQINVPEFLHGLMNVLRRNNVTEAVAICDETPGPVAHVLRTAIIRCDADEGALRQAVEEASLNEVPRLEQNLTALATIAHIAPLLGLLGTVLGMIGLFQTMESEGPLVATSQLANHIWRALLTTAAGLTVAIPTHAFYNLLVAKVESILLDMDKAAGEIIYFLTHNQLKLEDVPPPAVSDGEDSADED